MLLHLLFLLPFLTILFVCAFVCVCVCRRCVYSILPMFVVVVVVDVVDVDVVAHERNHYGTNTYGCCRLCHCMSLSSTCYHHHHHHHHQHHQIEQPSH